MSVQTEVYAEAISASPDVKGRDDITRPCLCNIRLTASTPLGSARLEILVTLSTLSTNPVQLLL